MKLLAPSADGPVYLDCAATSPIEPEVLDEMSRIWQEEPGNAGSRTHEYGLRAKKLLERAREQVASVVNARPDEVIFTSGATESNNIAILGLAGHGERTERRHVVSTAIEHKAVLEPLEHLRKCGFDVTLVNPNEAGTVSPDAIVDAVRQDTLLVSVMQTNNETGICQPIDDIAAVLADHETWLHVDAAQGFGKELSALRNARVDFISISSHKIFGPVGVGALVTRRRGFRKPPLSPIHYGGGQERGLRHGTLPVPLIAGLGVAAQIAERDHGARRNACLAVRAALLEGLAGLEPVFVGDQSLAIPNIANLAITGVDTEALMVALKDLIAISNGSACTSQSYEPSHVLKAMQLPQPVIQGAVR
ncbi:MAG: aminotransferase class V-fold PLP-dependent enzyme, partial [Gammaproteobacteria bacterium]|nr:aminotransferase class V-fold PLP-dependent enzyme [Gammaproteobacteria bacterium]